MNLLTKQYPLNGSKIPELREKFTAKQINNRAMNLGLSYMPKQSNRSNWTDYQINVLTANYHIYGADIPELLQYFSWSQITTKAYHLGLRRQESWSAEDDKLLVEEYPKNSTELEIKACI